MRTCFVGADDSVRPLDAVLFQKFRVNPYALPNVFCRGKCIRIRRGFSMIRYPHCRADRGVRPYAFSGNPVQNGHSRLSLFHKEPI